MGNPYLTRVGHVSGLPLLLRMVNPPVARRLYIQSAFSPNRIIHKYGWRKFFTNFSSMHFVLFLVTAFLA